MTTSFRIIFAGTPAFAATILQVLLAAGQQIVAVYTQSDKPAGRGQKLSASPVKQQALAYQIPVYQPTILGDPRVQTELQSFQADLMIVVAYGLILPAPVLTIPRLGCINVHASLLPRWRGAAPIQRALLAGDTETGITIMQMDQGLDTGAILHRQICPIRANDTAATLHDRLMELGAQALLTTLTGLAEGKVMMQQQDNALATYAHKMSKEEAAIDWRKPAVIIEREIRAFNPWPIAFTKVEGQILRIWQAELVPGALSGEPGEIVDVSPAGVTVVTGHGLLRLITVQFPGGRVLSVKDILNAKPLLLGLKQQLQAKTL